MNIADKLQEYAEEDLIVTVEIADVLGIRAATMDGYVYESTHTIGPTLGMFLDHTIQELADQIRVGRKLVNVQKQKRIAEIEEARIHMTYPEVVREVNKRSSKS